MKALHREAALILVLMVGLVSAALWSYARLDAAERAAHAAVEDSATAQNLADQIRNLQTRPTRAGLQDIEIQEIASRLETSASEAGITADRVIRIAPEPLRQIPKTPYQERLTRVEFRDVNLRQLITCLHPLSHDPPPFMVQSLRLTAIPGAIDERWNAEVTLSYLIYSPAGVEARP